MASSRGARGRSPSSHLVCSIICFTKVKVKLWHTGIMKRVHPLPQGDFERDCVLYLRKSKGKTGIARQRRECEATARRLKWRIIAEFEDKDTTAFMHVLDEVRVLRKDYQEMLDTLRQDSRDTPLGVLAWSYDRTHRNSVEVDQFIRICAPGSHPYETAVAGGYDLTTAAGRKRLKRDVGDAESEVDIMSERWQSDKRDTALLGKWLGGPVPFGWRAIRPVDDEPRVLILEPKEAEAIKWACESLVRDRISLNKIAAEWNRRGLRRRNKGDLWTGALARDTMLRPRNAALMEHLGEIVETSREDGKAQWPEIISEELWRAVVSILKANGRRSTPGPKPRWLGSRIYECGAILDDGGRCGGTLIVGGAGSGTSLPNRVRIPTYRCNAIGKTKDHVVRQAVDLDALVEMTLLARLSKPDIRADLARMEPPDVSGKRLKLATEVEALAEWERAAELPGASPLLIVTGATATKARIARLNAEIESAALSPIFAELVGADDIRALWKSKDLPWRRAVLRMFVTVVVGKAPRGTPHGYRAGQSKFDTSTIGFEWKPLGASVQQ